MRYKLVDRTGVKIRIGATVRVVGVPDLSGLTRTGRAEVLAVFRYLLGRYRKVVDFDDRGIGLVWLDCRIRNGPYAGLHTVWIEPWLLRVRRRAATKGTMRR